MANSESPLEALEADTPADVSPALDDVPATAADDSDTPAGVVAATGMTLRRLSKPAVADAAVAVPAPAPTSAPKVDPLTAPLNEVLNEYDLSLPTVSSRPEGAAESEAADAAEKSDDAASPREEVAFAAAPLLATQSADEPEASALPASELKKPAQSEETQPAAEDDEEEFVEEEALASNAIRDVYRNLAVIAGVLALILGIGAIAGGRFSDSFITKQMAAQNITMPTKESIDGQLDGGKIDAETARLLRPYAGKPLRTGSQARAYAMYIQAHMAYAGKQAGLSPEQATFSGLGQVIRTAKEELTKKVAADNSDLSSDDVEVKVKQEIANPATEYEQARKVASLEELRTDTMFTGNVLSGTLLNVYGWGLLGTIGTWVGWLLVLTGLGLLGAAFWLHKNRRA